LDDRRFIDTGGLKTAGYLTIPEEPVNPISLFRNLKIKMLSAATLRILHVLSSAARSKDSEMGTIATFLKDVASLDL
jgi:hypothetical protein